MALFVPPLLGLRLFSSRQAILPKSCGPSRKSVLTALIAVPRMLDLLHAGIERNSKAEGNPRG